MADIDGYLKQIKSAESGETVRDAIINCLRDINRDVPMVEEDWEGYMPESTDLTLSGHYKSVHVMHNPSSGKATKLTTLHVTENDTYEPEDENEYYNKVVVEVDQSPYTIKEEAVEITQNGTYYAKEDFGVNGLAEIRVNVNEVSSEGPFTVEFYSADKSTIVSTQSVPKNGKASCTIYDGTSINGEYFKGWNPSPSNVTRDLKCYPIFGEVIIGDDDIGDDWPIICEKRGAGYPLGSKKSLVVNIPARDANGELVWQTSNSGEWKSNSNGHIRHNAMNIAMHMVKVAEGEDGTTSTWLSTGVIPIYPYWETAYGGRGGPSYSANVQAYSMWQVYSETQGAVNDAVAVDWEGSAQREYLNEFLIENLPECLGATIKPVNKMFASFNRAPYKGTDVGYERGDVKVYKSSIDKIWIPSMQELHSYFEAHTGWGDYNADLEPNGIDYSAIYMPTYPGPFLTRTSHVGSNFVNCISAVGQDITVVTAGCPGAPIGFCL